MNRIRTPHRRPQLGAMAPPGTAPDRRRHYGLSGLVTAWDAASQRSGRRALSNEARPHGHTGKEVT